MGQSPQQMNDSIIRNLKDKTGKSLEEWIDFLRSTSLAEKKEIIQYLKEDKSVGHFQAQIIYQHFKETV